MRHARSVPTSREATNRFNAAHQKTGADGQFGPWPNSPPASFDSLSHSPITAEDIEDFRTLIRTECGVEMDEQEAWDRVIELVSLYRMFLGPLPEDPEGVRTSSGLATNSQPI